MSEKFGYFHQCVDSFEKLDVLLYVQGRAQPTHPLDIASGLRVSIRDVEQALDGLCGSGLLVQHMSGFVSEPRDEALREELAGFARACREEPLAIFSSLSTQVIARQRVGALRLRTAQNRRRTTRMFAR